MKVKMESLKEFLYCILYITILLLNIYSIYIDSLMPRIISYGVVLIIYMLHFTTKNQRIFSLKRIFYISFSFFIISFLSVIINGNTSVFTFEYFWDILQIFVFMSVGAIIAMRVGQSVRSKLYVIMMIGILFTIVIDFGGNYITYDERHYSIYANALLYGSFILIGFYFVFYLVKNLYIRIFLMILCAYACVLTYSRSAWVAMMITLPVGILFKNTEKLKKGGLVRNIIFLIVMFVLMFYFNTQILEKINDVMNIVDGKMNAVMQSTSAVIRLSAISYLWKKSTIFSLLFGNGVGATKDILINSGTLISRFRTSDNQYVTILFDYGLVGLYWIVQLCRLIISNVFLYEKSKEQKMLAVSLLAVMITGFFFEIMGNANLSAISLSLLGILYQLDFEEKIMKKGTSKKN